MLNKKSLIKVIDSLTPEVFYKKKNKILFRYIKIVYNKYNRIDLLTLISELKKYNKLKIIGGEIYITYLLNNYTNFYKIKNYVKLLIEKFILRRLIKISVDTINKINKIGINPILLINEIQDNIDNLNINYIDNKIKSIKKILPKTIKQINKKVFLPTGFTKLDNIILGLHKSDLIIVASRPGMGKTSFALSLIINYLKQNIPVGLFSLEMSYYQIMSRLLIFETGIPYDRLNNLDLTEEEINLFKIKINELNKYKFFLDDSSYLTITDLKNRCRQLIYKYKVKLIILDYLQLIYVDNNKFRTREQEISTISRNIKYIAKEFQIPIIAISQLSRAVEIRGGFKRPFLSDLRESGAIEQDADIVLLLYRPEYYGFKYWDGDITKPCNGQAEIIVSKHRNGKLGNLRLKFVQEKAIFENI
ncbi:MAG: replicative DNA helicase [Candidatus Shikimatogenerans bostrichidophilus]|nr:MAG: replicative DNA helicase [Candidatus Shikimatogenerans bostrichidophilus]